MKKLLLLCTAIGLATTCSASAASVSPSVLREALAVARAAVPVPEEWDGEWQVNYTLYLCPDQFIISGTRRDTLCAGVDFSQGVPNSEVTLTCTGTFTGTVIDAQCTGLEQIEEDCEAEYTVDIDGTRTADTFHQEITMNVHYVGSSPTCPIVDQCLRIVADGTRLGPAPLAYCSTPTLPATWGRVKAHYR